MFNNFADRMHILRRLRNATTYEVASKLFVSSAIVSKWEHGKHAPSIDTLNRIADEYDCSVDWLLGRTPIDDIKGAEND